MTTTTDTDLVFGSGGSSTAGTPTPILAAVDPTVVDDQDDGYAVGQPWVNTATDTWWVLTDAASGAAVWVQAGAAGGGTGDMTKAVYDPNNDGVIAIAQGGTGAATAAAARTALGLATVAASASAADLSAGTLPAARMPALTGDVTSSAGAVATTIATGAVTDTKASLAVKPAGTVAATTNQALTGTPTIDGQATAAGSVILCTAQTAPAENGPWVAAAGAWTRPSWYPAGGTTQAFQFITIFIRLGTLYQGSTWRMTTAGAITIDTTATTWSLTPLALGSVAPIADQTILGNNTGAPAAPLALTAAQIRTLAGLVIGTNVQAYDAELAALAALVSAADKVPFFTGSGTASLADLTSVARTLIAQTTQALMRTTGLGLTATGDAVATAASAAAARTAIGTVIGTDVQAFDAELAALAGLTSAADKLPYFTGSGTAALADLSAVARTLLAQTTQALMRTTGLGAAAIVDIQNFAASGTWTKPAGAKKVHVEIYGAGGGGGSGRRDAAGTVRCGGGAGAGGCANEAVFDASDLGATETVTIGGGGPGGIAQASNTANGNAGTAGGASTFGAWVRAAGGGGGSGGTGANGNGGSNGGGTGTNQWGNSNINGPSASATGGAGTAGTAVPRGPGPGGSGGGITSADASSAGAAGGRGSGINGSTTTTGGGGAAGTVGAGQAGGTGTARNQGGDGGGGGAGSITGAAGAGGPGSLPGGGAGGGGASLNGNASGAGGAGADGYCRVTTWF